MARCAWRAVTRRERRVLPPRRPGSPAGRSTPRTVQRTRAYQTGSGGQASQRGQVPEGEVVEHLHHLRGTQVPLEHLAAGQRAIVQLRYLPVPLRDVVDRVEDRLAGQRLHGYRRVGTRRMLTTTRSPAAAAPVGVAARARGPSSSTRSLRVCGPRELLSTTSYPAATANRATVPPRYPLPMKPIVVIPLWSTLASPPGSIADGTDIAQFGKASEKHAANPPKHRQQPHQPPGDRRTRPDGRHRHRRADRLGGGRELPLDPRLHLDPAPARRLHLSGARARRRRVRGPPGAEGHPMSRARTALAISSRSTRRTECPAASSASAMARAITRAKFEGAGCRPMRNQACPIRSASGHAIIIPAGIERAPATVDSTSASVPRIVVMRFLP